MSSVNDLTSGRPRVEQSLSLSPGGQPVPPDADPATEVAALAALLAEVVELAGQRAVFPSRWELIAELAWSTTVFVRHCWLSRLDRRRWMPTHLRRASNTSSPSSTNSVT